MVVEERGFADRDEHPDRDARMLPGIGDAGRDALVEVREPGRCFPGSPGISRAIRYVILNKRPPLAALFLLLVS